MNELACKACGKLIFVNQRSATSRRHGTIHYRCLPLEHCWECRGEGSYPINERQRMTCPRCKGTGKTRQ